MSHHPLRTENDCLNCGATVENRYCSHCGQENIINRPSFAYLFKHFFGDLFHYDSGFWRTMKTLLFRPGILVRDYLNGKRKSYVEPAKLYIFVSFVAFFIPHFLPDFTEKENEEVVKTNTYNNLENFEGIEIAGHPNIKTVAQLDSLQESLPDTAKISKPEYLIMKQTLKSIENGGRVTNKDGDLDFSFAENENFNFSSEKGISYGKNYQNITTVAQFDSIHHALPESKRLGWIQKSAVRKVVDLVERDLYKKEDLFEKFKEAFKNNLPKALFAYLPIFAFSLWLIHKKKKWYFYDHGIFTLYFFSAVLIFISLYWIVNTVITLPVLVSGSMHSLVNTIQNLVSLAFVGYVIFYFFRAHHRVYQENAWKSRLKCFILIILNSFLLTFLLMCYTLFTFMII